MKEDAIFLSEIYGWSVHSENDQKAEIVFKRKGVKLRLRYLTMNVYTSLNHPKLGMTQLVRKNVSMEMFEDILFNPRTHTDIGRIIKNHTDRVAWLQKNKRLRY